MSALTQTVLLSMVIAFVYVWLHVPTLAYYSLQIYALSIVFYFILKYLSRAKFWHIAPTAHSLEMMVATFSFLLLIGSTGNTSSVLYPLGYVHLFFLVFATPISTSIITTLLIILFHFGLSEGNLYQELPHLLTLPLMLILFLFTKHQHQELILEKHMIQQEEQNIGFVQKFLQEFINPKLTLLKNLSENAYQNQDGIISQIMLIEIEINKLIAKLDTRKKVPQDEIETE
jgi:hypothetical protein